MARRRADYWESATPETFNRLIVSACALGGGGKTEFGAHAGPRDSPLVYLSIDPNNRAVVAKVMAETQREIILKEFRKLPMTISGRNDSVQDLAKEQWDNFCEANERIVQGDSPLGDPEDSRNRGTVVWDTATEFFDLAFIAEFGRTNQIQWYQRAPVNKVYADMIDAYRATPFNLVLLHRLKKQYAEQTKTVRGRRGEETKTEREWTGAFEREGYNKMEFLIDTEVHLTKDLDVAVETDADVGDRFGMSVVKCTTRPFIEGKAWVGRTKRGTSKASFAWLAFQVYPDTTVQEWK